MNQNLIIPPSSLSKSSILIVDDSTYNIFVLSEILSLQPLLSECEISSALNGQEALNLITQTRDSTSLSKCKYSLIFMDLHMPVMDGT